jgi:hypothetical protein
MKTPIWFHIDKPKTPADINLPHSFDRHVNLISFWFDLFSTSVPTDIKNNNLNMTVQTEEKLDYKNMV